MPSLTEGWIDRVFIPGIVYFANDQGIFIWNYLRGKQFKKLLKGKTASIYKTSMAPTWWYKVVSDPIDIPDSYRTSVLKNVVLNHCSIKIKSVSILGELGPEMNTSLI
jgi:flavin reductase